MRSASRRPAFWIALALAVVAGVGTIVLLTSSVEVSRGVIVLQCGDALAPKTGAEVDVQTIQAAGAILVHPCDDPIRQRRLVSALVGVATIAALIWLGLEIRRSQNDEPLTA